MNARVAASVLAKAGAYDPTMPKPDHIVLQAWMEALDGIGQDDALAAVTDHYRETSRRIMPADVIGIVSRRRETARLWAQRDSDPNAVPDADPDNVTEWLAALRSGRLVNNSPAEGSRAGDVTKLIQTALKPDLYGENQCRS